MENYKDLFSMKVRLYLVEYMKIVYMGMHDCKGQKFT